MKIAVSTMGNNIEDMMDGRFGRCEYFYIYDTITDKSKFIENKGKEASGGAGIAAAQQIIDEEAEVVITGALGPNAYKLIEGAKIEAYKSNEEKISTVIENYKKELLEKIQIAGKAHHGSL